MKLIDLLVKISRGEEVPKKIKYCMILFNFDGDDYLSVGNSEYYIPDDTSIFKWVFGQRLNDEVEIIEEDTKIEKLMIPSGKIPPVEREFQSKINELINEVNELKKGK